MKTLQIFDASEGTGTARGEGGVGNRKCFKPVGCGGQQNLASSAEWEAVRRSPRHGSRPLGAATASS